MKKTLALIALVAAAAAFGEAVPYDPAVHGNPIAVTGDAVVEIDGNGATVDGGGTNRCATLGPNVTLWNFAFKNGKAELGGGVYGGRIVNCTVTGCRATESGAALCNCVADNCTITGNTFDNGYSTAAAHGGILFGSTLTDCTVTDNAVTFGSEAPTFGGIGDQVTLTGCTLTGNTVTCGSETCYGKYFAYSTVDGVPAAEFVDDDPQLVPPPDDPPPDDPPPDDPPPGPTPADPTDVFVGNATYVGWLISGDGIGGTLTVKAGKASKGFSKVTVTYTPVGGKKKTVKLTVPVGSVVTNEVTGLVFSGSSVGGTFLSSGVTAYADPLKSANKQVKSDAKAAVPSGTWTFLLDDGFGHALPFTATVAAKTAKTKLTGYLSNGKKVSVSAQGVLHDGNGTLSVPVCYAKQGLSFAFVLEVSVSARTARIVPSEQVVEAPRVLNLPSGLYAFAAQLPAGYATEARAEFSAGKVFSLSPDGELVSVFGGKMTLANKKAVGKVKAAGDGGLYVQYKPDRQVPANLSALKVKYTSKTGVLSGSFKLYRTEGGKLKTVTVKVYGVAVGEKCRGLAVAKTAGLAFDVEIRPAP